MTFSIQSFASPSNIFNNEGSLNSPQDSPQNAKRNEETPSLTGADKENFNELESLNSSTPLANKEITPFIGPHLPPKSGIEFEKAQRPSSWTELELRIIHHHLFLNGIAKNVFKTIATILAPRSESACKQAWRSNKIDLISMYGEIPNMLGSNKPTEHQLATIYRHMTYEGESAANYERAATELKISFSRCKHIWSDHKPSLIVKYGPIIYKPLPPDLAAMQIAPTSIRNKCVHREAGTETKGGAAWQEEEIDILYQEMTYIGTQKDNMSVASAKLKSRSPPTCLRMLSRYHKQFLTDKVREEKFGKLDSKKRSIDPTKITSNTHSLSGDAASTIEQLIDNSSLAKRRRISHVAEKEVNHSLNSSIVPATATVNTIQEIIMPLMNIQSPSMIASIPNQSPVSSTSITNSNPIPRNAFKPLQNDSSWKIEAFETLVRYMLCPGKEEDNLEAVSSILKRSVPQCKKSWTSRTVYLAQYMTILAIQANYRPWSEEECREFASMVNPANSVDSPLQLGSTLHLLACKLNRPFLECFALWEHCKSGSNANIPMLQHSQEAAAIVTQSQKASGLDLLIAALEDSDS